MRIVKQAIRLGWLADMPRGREGEPPGVPAQQELRPPASLTRSLYMARCATTLVRGGAVALVLVLAMVITSCNQVPVQPHPLVGEGEPPGYIDGQIPDQYKGMTNPFSLQDTAAYAAGAGLYLGYEPSCVTCHGTSGRGDGPLVPYLEPRPADFGAPPMLNAFRNNQDYVFWWIAEGLPKTVMPSYRERLTDTQIWQVMIYAWYLGEQAAQNPIPREQLPAQRPARPPFLPPAQGGAVKP